MERVRKYGGPPFVAAVIHGGPGASGEMAPVARELSRRYGTLEPMQTSTSVEGQLQELRSILEEHGRIPLTLIGHSWGAWLGYMLAAQYPVLVKKLIMVGSGPFEERYSCKIMETRLGRLSGKERTRTLSLLRALNDPNMPEGGNILAQFGSLMAKADSFDPVQDTEEADIICQSNIIQRVWNEATELRSSGRLLEMGKKIQCPVVAIHGDYDPHPSEGVERPLFKAVGDFRFILLKDCGHDPWKERYARDRFYQIVVDELGMVEGG